MAKVNRQPLGIVVTAGASVTWCYPATLPPPTRNKAGSPKVKQTRNR